MSVKIADLSVLAYANNFTVWHYVTTENSLAELVDAEANYFGKAQDMMRANDMLIINASDANATAWVMESAEDKVVIALPTMP